MEKKNQKVKIEKQSKKLSFLFFLYIAFLENSVYRRGKKSISKIKEMMFHQIHRKKIFHIILCLTLLPPF